jgi:hypothetical protein
MNLRPPCTTPPIGFVLRLESGSRQELKIGRMYLDGCSLLEVISVNLTGNNIRFDLDHCIQIVDFHAVVLEVGESESEEGTQLVRCSSEGWTSEKDIRALMI